MVSDNVKGVTTLRHCAIDIHHHFLPPGLVEEAKRHGKTLGVEIIETKEGRSTLCIAGGTKSSLTPDLIGLENRLAMMEKGKIAIAALEPHTASLGYRLDGQKGETWCNLYNEGIRELIRQHPDRFVG